MTISKKKITLSVMLEGLKQSWVEAEKRTLTHEQYQEHISGLTNPELVGYLESYKRGSDRIWVARGVGVAMMTVPILLEYMAHIDSEQYHAAASVFLLLGVATNILSLSFKSMQDGGFRSVTEELRNRFVTNTQADTDQNLRSNTALL